MKKAIQQDTLEALINDQVLREPLRTWASLTAVGRFAETVDITEFSVEL